VQAFPQSLTPDTNQGEAAVDRWQVDQSCRRAVLTWIVSATVWLLVGSIFGLLTSFKFHIPYLLDTRAELTLGRLRAMHLDTVAFGWATMSAVATAVWLMCRLSRVQLRYAGMVTLAAWIWNFGLIAGLAALAHGNSTSVEWLEFPAYVPPIFVLSIGIVSIWTISTFRNRREKQVYVTQWYIYGAMFWFPWIYTTATLLCTMVFATGVVQAAVNWWFAHNFLGLWVTPIGVGTAYYLIPKVLGRPVYSYHLSVLGFWALALFYSWAGMHHLIGGPIPAWMISASVVGSMMMLIPVIAVAINHHMTMRGNFRELRYSPVLRFTVFGAVSYTAVSIQGSFEALRSFSEVAHFTHYTVGHAHLGLYGFFSMTMFGAAYYYIPRLTGREWASGLLMKGHFWASAFGITLYFVALSVGGWFQGLANITPSIKHIEIVQSTLPYLFLRSIGGSFMVLGHVLFALLVFLNLMGYGSKRTTPTEFSKR